MDATQIFVLSMGVISFIVIIITTINFLRILNRTDKLIKEHHGEWIKEISNQLNLKKYKGIK